MTLLLALASAILVVLAAPPFDFWPLAPVALAPLYLAVRAASPRSAFLHGWLCGLAISLGTQHWLVDVLARFAGSSRPAGWLALLGLAAYQGVVLGLTCFASAALRRRLSPFLAMPLLLAVAESLVPFVFPWCLAIVAWKIWPVTQLAELGGPPAVSAWLMLVSLILVEGVLASRGRSAARGLVPAAVIALCFLGVGMARALHVDHARGAARPLTVALVQSDQGILSLAERQVEGQGLLDQLRAQSEEAGRRGAGLVVWPESAFPYLLDRTLADEFPADHPWALRGSYTGRLLFGALSHDFGSHRVFNSATLVAADGHYAGRQDKQRLVAGGEYVPFAARFPAWAARMRAALPEGPDITPGREAHVLVDGELRVGALICYEELVAAHVAALVRAGDPNLLVTLAHHAWFDGGPAAAQSLALASFRAIEARRDLVRATSTGVSSTSDALGRVRERLPAHRRDLLVDEVRLLEIPALGPVVAPLFPWLCLLALAVALLARRAPEEP